jgi:hypothetical protein
MATRAEATGDGGESAMAGAHLLQGRGAGHSCYTRNNGGNGWGRETRLVRVFFGGREGLMASAAPRLHVLAF